MYKVNEKKPKLVYARLILILTGMIPGDQFS